MGNVEYWRLNRTAQGMHEEAGEGKIKRAVYERYQYTNGERSNNSKGKNSRVEKEKLNGSTGKLMEQLTKRKERKKRNKEQKKLEGIIKSIEKENKKEMKQITDQY